MANLGKREKIILAVMAILILYAAFDFLAPKMKGEAEDTTRKTAELNSFAADIAAGAGKDLAKNLGPLIFSRAEKEWTQDPFLDARIFRLRTEAKAPPKETPAAAAAPKIEFVYTGYLEVGGKRMAIINGVEYRESEDLDIKGYVLNAVSPTRVVVENRATGTLLNIPLQE
jgi:hypothetical protein